MNDFQCTVLGCLEPSMNRLPFCVAHLYEHRICEVFGCLEKLPLTSRRCRSHPDHSRTKVEIARENAARREKLESAHAAE